jgi:putative glutamine amidotransferase
VSKAKRPRIYITSERYPAGEQSGPQYDRVRTTYAWCVAEAGGVPYVLPSVGTDADLAERYLDSADGLLFSGGEDIHPSLYGERVLEKCGPIDEQRDRFEMALFRGALERGVPVLGICRGMQLIVVASGGSLYQDLSYCERADAGHAGTWQQSGAMPSVRLLPGTLLHQIMGEEHVSVNCHHHQLIKRLDQGCRVSAVSPDGMIEGVEVTGPPFVLGVHWHPERLAAGDLPHRKLFEALIRAASEYSQRSISRARS